MWNKSNRYKQHPTLQLNCLSICPTVMWHLQIVGVFSVFTSFGFLLAGQIETCRHVSSSHKRRILRDQLIFIRVQRHDHWWEHRQDKPWKGCVATLDRHWIIISCDVWKEKKRVQDDGLRWSWGSQTEQETVCHPFVKLLSWKQHKAFFWLIFTNFMDFFFKIKAHFKFHAILFLTIDRYWHPKALTGFWFWWQHNILVGVWK